MIRVRTALALPGALPLAGCTGAVARRLHRRRGSPAVAAVYVNDRPVPDPTPTSVTAAVDAAK